MYTVHCLLEDDVRELAHLARVGDERDDDLDRLDDADDWLYRRSPASTSTMTTRAMSAE